MLFAQIEAQINFFSWFFICACTLFMDTNQDLSSGLFSLREKKDGMTFRDLFDGMEMRVQ